MNGLRRSYKMKSRRIRIRANP